jgi:hypothetical protein
MIDGPSLPKLRLEMVTRHLRGPTTGRQNYLSCSVGYVSSSRFKEKILMERGVGRVGLVFASSSRFKEKILMERGVGRVGLVFALRV